MQDSHIIHEANVASFHSRSQLVLSSNEVYCIQRFCLGLAQSGYAICSRIFRRMPNQQTAGEVRNDFSILTVHESTLVVGWVPAEPDAFYVSFVKDSFYQVILRIERPVGLS